MADSFQTSFESRTLGRGGDAIGGSRRKRKKKSAKSLNDKRRGKKGKKKQQPPPQQEDVNANISRSSPMQKLYNAHPRHVIKLILKKLCETPSFYRMLGTLGIALKSSGVSLEEFFLSSSNKLPKTLRNKLRYDVNDQRVLILARLAVHKMLIREGTRLKSAIHSYGTYPAEYDSDEDDQEIRNLPPQHRPMKKGLKYIDNDKFAEKMQSENPQGLLFIVFIHKTKMVNISCAFLSFFVGF